MSYLGRWTLFKRRYLTDIRFYWSIGVIEIDDGKRVVGIKNVSMTLTLTSKDIFRGTHFS